MTTERTPGALGSNDQLGVVPEREAAASEMARLLDLTARQDADVLVLEAAAAVVSRALNDFVGACMDPEGKPWAPTRGALMKARAMLPPTCKHALTRA
jgi:hypothetical protein